MKKKLLVLAVMLAMILSMGLMAGCGEKTGGSAEGDDAGEASGNSSSDTLVVGLDDAFAPMGFRDEDGELVGFDIDLAEAVAEELGMKVEFKPIDWNAKEAELKAGTVDCLWNGMSVTPDRIWLLHTSISTTR